MDKRFNEIYSDLYRGEQHEPVYGIVAGQPTMGDEIRMVVDRANKVLLKDGSPGLRSDAKYFLRLNLQHMVAVPLDRHGGSEYLVDVDMDDDVLTIARAAARKAHGSSPRRTTSSRRSLKSGIPSHSHISPFGARTQTNDDR